MLIYRDPRRHRHIYSMQGGHSPEAWLATDLQWRDRHIQVWHHRGAAIWVEVPLAEGWTEGETRRRRRDEHLQDNGRGANPQRQVHLHRSEEKWLQVLLSQRICDPNCGRWVQYICWRYICYVPSLCMNHEIKTEACPWYEHIITGMSDGQAVKHSVVTLYYICLYRFCL